MDGDGFEFGDELAQAAVGGEVGAEPLGVLGGEGPGECGDWRDHHLPERGAVEPDCRASRLVCHELRGRGSGSAPATWSRVTM